MLRIRLSILSLAALGALAVLTSPAAHADYTPPSTTTPGVSGNTINITVTGSGVKSGSGGTDGGTRTVAVKAPCVYTQGYTGKKYYEYVKSGGPMGRDTEGNPFPPYEGYEQYKDDDKGHWYGGMCSSADYNGSLDEFIKFSNQWFDEHSGVYVQENETPPVPPVPVELLRDVAFDEMTVPAPEIDWNPKHAGDLASVVNIDTWVWLRDRRPGLYVEASVDSMAGRISARVDATLTGMTVSGPNGESADCAGSGVPYAPGATGECSIRFVKASPGQSKSPVTVKTGWATTWSTPGQDPVPTPEQLDPAPATTNIRVLEIQTITR